MSDLREQTRTGQGGFTLIELLVVVLIIGILAAIAIPAFLGQKRKAQDTAAKSIVRSGVIAAESYYVEEQTFAGLLPAMLADHEQNVHWRAEAEQALATDDAIKVIVFGTEGYGLATQSTTGTVFSYIRTPTGEVFRCSGTAAPPSGVTPTGCAGAYSGGW